MPRKNPPSQNRSSTKSAVKRSPAIASKPAKEATAPAAATTAAAAIVAKPTVAAVVTPTTVVEVPKAVVETKPAAAAAPVPSAPAPAVLEAIERLGSFDADTARDAATTLGQLGDLAAVEPLIAALINADGFHHVVVRAAAAESLGVLGDRRALPSLLNAIDDAVAEVSLEAIYALKNLGDARATAALQQVVNDNTGFYAPMVHRAAENVLGQLTR